MKGELTEGINIKSLKNKYKKNMETEFEEKDLEAFEIENKEELYKDLENFNVFDDDEVIFFQKNDFFVRINKNFKKKN